jgi:hypothetical protein
MDFGIDGDPAEFRDLVALQAAPVCVDPETMPGPRPVIIAVGVTMPTIQNQMFKHPTTIKIIVGTMHNQ